jgi:type I restriction enzyme, S subunit
MSNWKTYKISELISEGVIEKPLDGNHGNIHPKSSDYVVSGIPFVMATDIVDGRVDLNGCKFISNELAKTLKKGFAKEGDILLTHKASIGRTSIVPSIKSEFVVLTPQVTYYRVKDKTKLDNIYLKYYFSSNEFQEQLNNFASAGSTRAYIGITDQQQLSIKIPEDIHIQRRIAEILSALDDKIELNRRMNQTLEQMAQTLFRQYFVDGIDEENLSEGWKIGKLGDVSKNIRKTINPKQLQEECKYVGLEHIPRKSIALTDWSTSVGVESQKYRFEQNHILFGKLRPYFHKVILAPFEGICSTDILVIEPLKDYMLAFCLLHYSSEEVVQYSNQLSHGTRMPRADWKGLSDYEIAIPPKELFIHFNNLILPSLLKIKANLEEIQTLTQLRDTLLPKLMSGEIDVMQTQPSALYEPVLS